MPITLPHVVIWGYRMTEIRESRDLRMTLIMDKSGLQTPDYCDLIGYE